MSIYTKEQVINEIKVAALQIDESTDLSSCSQLLVSIRYVHNGKFREIFLLCFPLYTITNDEIIKKMVNDYFSDVISSWENKCAIYPDGTPALFGSD